MEIPKKSLEKRLKEAATLENGVLLLALFIAGSLLWNTMNALQENFAYQQQVDIMQQENELLELETQNLEFQKRYYESPEYIELSARERLGKVEEGEKVIILPPVADSEGQVATVSASATRETPGNFEQWLYFFFGAGADRS